MSTMTDFPESHKDLLDAPVAALTTIGSNGYPQSTLLWFLHDGGELRTSLSTNRRKTKNLLKDPKVSLLIIDYGNPQRYLEVRGNAVITPDDDFAFANKLGAKYGADLSTYDPPGTTRVQVTIDPTNVYAVDLSA
jgi:PPOX class probable F420-dependent enzyme